MIRGFVLWGKDSDSDCGAFTIIVLAQSKDIALKLAEEHLRLKGREDLISALVHTIDPVVIEVPSVLHSDVETLPPGQKPTQGDLSRSVKQVSDYEIFVEMLKRAEIRFEIGSNDAALHYGRLVSGTYNTVDVDNKTIGYNNFLSTWLFDINGKLLDTGAYEK